jgi:hypothetical protein
MIWHDNREVGCVASMADSISVSISEGASSFSTQASSTYTWHVAHDMHPPHSATMPGTQLRVAPSMTLNRGGKS